MGPSSASTSSGVRHAMPCETEKKETRPDKARKTQLRKLRKRESVIREYSRSGTKKVHAAVHSVEGSLEQAASLSRNAKRNDPSNPPISLQQRVIAAEKDVPQLPPVTLGRLKVTTPVILSPMAGETNWPFRVLCERYGKSGLYVGEMITARAIVANNEKAWRLTRFAPSEKIRSLQVYGVNPRWIAQAIRAIIDKAHPDHIDLNFGCPVAKITRHGGGSALPWKEDLFAADIHAAVEAAKASGTAITAKMRIGIDDEHETYLRAGKIAQEEGIDAVTLHARTTAQFYGGHSDWSAIRRLKEELDIPVFGNGDIWSAEDALEMVRQTGCDGVAVARGAMGRPWIFANIRSAFEGSTKRINPSLGQVGQLIVQHATYLKDFYDGDEQHAARDMRKHIANYLKDFPVGGAVRRQFMAIESIDDIKRLLDGLDPDLHIPPTAIGQPRGRIRFQRKVHLPYGWLDSRTTTPQEREVLFGEDPMDASY